MNLYVLSENHPDNNHVGWLGSENLEEVIGQVFDPTFLYPLNNETIQIGRYKLPDQPIAFARRCRHRLFKNWYEIDPLPKLGKEPNVLLVIGMTPHFLLSMHALGPLLDQFDLRIGYLLDGFSVNHLDRTVLPKLDHLFVISAELADDIRAAYGINARFMPLAVNAFNAELQQQPRWIDILSYGRRNEELHKQLIEYTNRPSTDRFYFYSTFSQPELLDKAEHVTLQSRLLNNSKINLCFEASNIPRFQGYSPILYRWFESWAYGCTIVGKRPFGQGVAELMDWENSAIDIPDDPLAWTPFLEDLLQDTATLKVNAQRNFQQCLLRHDWRYRLRDIWAIAGLPMPPKLHIEIKQLQEKAGKAEVAKSRTPIYIGAA